MKWLAKRSLLKVPLVGWSMGIAGDVLVRRESAASGRDALAQCARWIARGVPVMIFPEGTRSRTRAMLPFRDGAFRLAIETGADLLPLAISGTANSLPRRSWRFARARALVKTGAPISTRGMNLGDVSRLKELARAQIEAMREELRPLTTA
jgi:1-acyl-sn-glycerol-3-phosphate acyltransferase